MATDDNSGIELFEKHHLTLSGDLDFDIQMLLDKYHKKGIEDGVSQVFELDSRFNVGSTATRIGQVYVGWIQHKHGRNKIGDQINKSKTFRA